MATSLPVLFVISCQNYEAFPGFRLNNPAFTAFPYEEEILLSEGCPVLILDIVRDFEITSSDQYFKNFKNKRITIIHLYLPDFNVDR